MSWMDKRKDHGTGSTGFDPMPEGDYVIEVVKASLVPTKNKSGRILTLELVVVSDDFNGRKVFERLNVENPNPVAERIGLERLNQLIDCAGLEDPQGEDELVGAVSGVHFKIRDDEGYKPDNEVSYFKPADDCKLGEYSETPAKKSAPAGSSKPAGSGKAQTEKAESTGAKKKPWEK